MHYLCFLLVFLFPALACAQTEDGDCYFTYAYSGSEAESIVEIAALQELPLIATGDSSSLILPDSTTNCVIRISTEACSHYITIVEIQTAEEPGTTEWEKHAALFREIFSILCDYCDPEAMHAPDEDNYVYDYFSDLTELTVRYEKRQDTYVVTLFRLLKPL